jgi:putative transposase
VPDRFHLALRPPADGDPSRFVRRLTLARDRRRHAHRHSAGAGHPYRGRFKPFPVEGGADPVAPCGYVGRDALRADLVARAEEWRRGSLCQRAARRAAGAERPELSARPVARPPRRAGRVNGALSPAGEESVRRTKRRRRPLGGPGWQAGTAARLGRGRRSARAVDPGRPKKVPDTFSGHKFFEIW